MDNALALTVTEYVPAWQAVHSVDPEPGVYEPVTHWMHLSGVLNPVPVEYVPPRQKIQLEDVTAFKVVEYVPATHKVHKVDAVPSV